MSEAIITRDAVEALRKERDTLRQQLAEAQLPSLKHVQEIYAVNKLQGEIDTLRQQLLACEASRERLKELSQNMIRWAMEPNWDYFNHNKAEWDRLLLESPSTTLAEYLRPVIRVLEEVAELDLGEQPCIASDAKKILSTLLTALGKEKV